MTSQRIETLVQSDTLCGEGPHWDVASNTLYFVDIPGKSVNQYNPANKKYSKIKLGGEISLVVPWEGKKNTFIVTRDQDIVSLKWDGCENGQSEVNVLKKVDTGKNTRFNDGKCDSKGRLWAGTMGQESAPGVVDPGLGSLYLLDNELQLTTKQTNVGISNGLAWSRDNKLMYFIDSVLRTVDVYDYDEETAAISNKRIVIDFQKQNILGLPDGMTMDTEGKLWVASFMGKKVLRIDPERGQVLRDITFPCSKITSVAWGGPQLDELYVTSASKELEPGSEPMAGSLFRVTGTGQKGFPPSNFIGSS